MGPAKPPTGVIEPQQELVFHFTGREPRNRGLSPDSPFEGTIASDVVSLEHEGTDTLADEIKRHMKPKLTVDEQIAHPKMKGVTFSLCSEDEARECLTDKTYYYKIAAYRMLFQKRVGGEHDGEYIGLDFGHFKDLAVIDQMLRYALLPMTLDVEHFAKVKLLQEVTDREDEDGYRIVADYFASLSLKNRRIREGEIERLKGDRYSGDIAKKYERDMPAWVLVELLSFGGFINFYLFCSKRWGDQLMKDDHYLLRQAQAVRNCCAHSTDLINGFASGERTNIKTQPAVATALGAIGINKRARRSKMANARVQQITMLAYAYKAFVKGDHSRQMCRTRIKELEGRAVKHADWYADVDSVRSSYKFLTCVFDSWV